MSVLFKGQSEFDAGYFFCPYWPGITDLEIVEVNAKLRTNLPTLYQIALIENIRNTPNINWN